MSFHVPLIIRGRVIEDADLELAAPKASLAANFNAGQDCTAATRIYIERSRFAPLREALVEAMRAVVVADPFDPASQMGPLISRGHRERVAGFVERDAGHVWLDGANVTGDPAWKRGLGVVFQSYALFPHMTVAENVAFGLRERGVPRRELETRVADSIQSASRLRYASSPAGLATSRSTTRSIACFFCLSSYGGSSRS